MKPSADEYRPYGQALHELSLSMNWPAGHIGVGAGAVDGEGAGAHDVDPEVVPPAHA
jgi:hypothetical protein